MKILYFVHTYGEKNGIASHLANVIGSLPQGFDAQVIAGSGKGLPLFSSLRIPAVEILRAARADFDVMHVHGYGNFYSFFGALVCALRGKPLVWTIHGYPRMHGARKALYYVYRYLMAPFVFWKADSIISVSSDILPILQKETGKKITIMPNGIDLELFKPKGGYRKAECLCFVGRLDPDKGAERLLECSTLPLLFIGPDEDGTRGRIIAEAEKLGRKASFAEANYSQMPEQYERCRYVALPSKYEGFPLTLLEAAAMERPFISTDVGEVKATLSKLFSKPEKYLLSGSLQEKVDELEKQDLSRELVAARKNCEEYSWKKIAEKLCVIYKGLSASSSTTAG